VFNVKTVQDGIDLEFDGSCKLYITIRFRRYAYSSNLEGCDPLLASQSLLGPTPSTSDDVDNDNSETDGYMITVGSEFEDDTDDGCLYRVIGINASHVRAKCFYPRRDIDRFGCEKLFEIALATDFIKQRAT
jgi:hypothetical protein